MEAPKCMKCIHYYVTFDATAPRGCRLYKLKSAQMPSQIIKSATGKECSEFSERKKKVEEKESFNDPKYWKDEG